MGHSSHLISSPGAEKAEEGRGRGRAHIGRSTYTRSSSSKENQASQIRSTLVAQRAGGIDQGRDAVALQGGADDRGAPGHGGAAGLLGADELLLGVGELGALVGGAQDGGEHDQLDAVVEGGAEGDG